MPFYYEIENQFDPEDRQRVLTKLIDLRKQLHDEVPAKNVRDSLILATWNIRDFDSNTFGHGPRLKESLYYIAEVISSFDLVAVQEINDLPRSGRP